MTLAAAALILILICLTVVSLLECHINVGVLQDRNSSRESSTVTAPLPDDVLFTQSLLALGKVGLQVPDGSRSPARAESSSLALARLAQ